MTKEMYEKICFEIISYAGTAKSCFLEAIDKAKEKQDTESCLKEGYEAFQNASKAHQKALQLDAKNELEIGLLLIHAETILCSAETIRDLSETIIQLYQNQ